MATTTIAQPMTTTEKAGIVLGALAGYAVLGFGFWAVTGGAIVGYVVGRKIDPSYVGPADGAPGKAAL